MKKYGVSLALFLSLLLCSMAFAAPPHIPARAAGYMNDNAHMLTQQQAQLINRQLSQFDKKTSNQVVVATFNTLGGGSLDDFSMQLATKWKIGTRKHDNGVLLLIIKNDHKMRIEVGYGLEGALTDALSGLIIRNEIAPSFHQGHYYQGIENGVQAIMKATQGEYKPTAPAGATAKKILGLIIFLFFIGIFLLSMLTRGGSGYVVGTAAGLFLGGLGGGSGGGFGDGGGFSGGGGGFGGGGADGGW